MEKSTKRQVLIGVIRVGRLVLPAYLAFFQPQARVEPYRDSQREVYSRKVRAGKRTYIFDVRSTRGNDFYLTITERKRMPDGYSYQKQKIYLYKEDFVKFINGLQDVIGYVRTELLPDYDFEQHGENSQPDDDPN